MSSLEEKLKFPDEIIFEILLHLPTKPIHRFKCVSKTWLSIISTPHFISTYISLNSPSLSWAILDTRLRLITGHTQRPISLSLAGPPEVSTLTIGPHLMGVAHPENLLTPQVLGRGNGLVFCVVKEKIEDVSMFMEMLASVRNDNEHDFMLVCNPVNRKWVRIPSAPDVVRHVGALGFCTKVKVNVCGLYEVGFVIAELRPEVAAGKATLMVFSSVTGEWEKRVCKYSCVLGYQYRYSRCDGAFEFEGRLFWIDLSCGLVVWDRPFSSGGDDEVEVEVECCVLIAFPQDPPRIGLERERSVHSGGGYIQYIVMDWLDGDMVLTMWRLMNVNVVGAWTIMYRVHFKDVKSDLPNDWFMTLSSSCFIHPFDPNVAVFAAGDYVVSVDLRGRKVVNCAFYPKTIPADNSLVPLVLPCWPTAFSPRFEAVLAKNRGNELFKKKNYGEAVFCYSRSITHSPTDVAYANRAAAFLKIGNYLEAESDCTEALKLNEQYTKAYWRRAMARKQLGRLVEAKEDAEFALKLDPQQQEILKLCGEVKSLLEEVKN